MIIIDKRISEILYITKFLFIIMVVYIHSYAMPNMSGELVIPHYVTICKDIITDGICSMAIPGFFFISGIFVFIKEFTWYGNIKKKIRTIIVPYLIINTFWIVFFAIVSYIPFLSGYFTDEAYQIQSWEDIYHAYLGGIPLYYPFWFLRDLFLLNILAKVIRIAIDKIPVLLAILMSVMYLGGITLPLFVVNYSLLMFVLAGFCVKYRNKLRIISNIRTWQIILGIIILIVIREFFWKNNVTNLCSWLVGIVGWYRIAGILQKSKISSKILWCSQFSFFIYAFHEYYEAMIKKILFMFIPQSGEVLLLEFILLPIFMIILLIIVGNIFKQFLPRCYGTICGQRNER